MAKVLIVGAGGVGGVVVHKCASVPEVFDEIVLASRTLPKCDAIAREVHASTGRTIATRQIDADDVPALAALLRAERPALLINVALPYQDLHIMDACLETGTHYLDTANYEPRELARFEYSWQWAYQERFLEAGLTAILGCGFDPGATNLFTAWLARHHFDEIHTLDIVDCNAGNHGQAFATNFNPEINIREITQRGRYWQDGAWHETDPLSVHKPIDYPDIGPRESYLLYHEELESLVLHYPTLRRARFWMTFSEAYITHLQVLENVGMTRIDTVDFNGQQIIPLEFLKAVLPTPSSLGENYTGWTSIGVRVRGIKDGKPIGKYVWNNCDHAACWNEVRAQAVSYTTGVPAMIGAKLFLEGKWAVPGVHNVEQLDPDPFMDDMNRYGLPWQVADIDPDPESD